MERLPNIDEGDDLSFRVNILDDAGELVVVDAAEVSARGPSDTYIEGAVSHAAGVVTCVFDDKAFSAGLWDVRVRARLAGLTQTVFRQQIVVGKSGFAP